VYVDAHVDDIKAWFVRRFLRLRETAFARPESHFHRYASLSDDAASDLADNIWETINAPNLRQNIMPTRSLATLVLSKGEDHSVRRVRLRRL
jgi:type I pantothenate kinase